MAHAQDGAGTAVGVGDGGSGRQQVTSAVRKQQRMLPPSSLSPFPHPKTWAYGTGPPTLTLRMALSHLSDPNLETPSWTCAIVYFHGDSRSTA